MRIVLGSDHFGYPLKATIIEHLEQLGHEPVDLGCDNAADPVDYPDVARDLAERIAAGEFERGILVCGTGLGMAIVANKVPGVRAATCHDPYSAERVRKSNNAQIMTMGAQIVGPGAAKLLIDHWLASEFQGGRSERKVKKIEAIDQHYARAAEKN